MGGKRGCDQVINACILKMTLSGWNAVIMEVIVLSYRRYFISVDCTYYVTVVYIVLLV